ncbi:hypothetical protein ACP4OV_011219 [Aristida adscensionis]
MAPAVGVVDISSDEEDRPAGDSVPLDLLGWASELFGEDDDLDDLMIMSDLSSPPPALQKRAKPDDLVIMNELSSPPVLQKKSKLDDGHNVDDDDCVVLDGDPDKAVTVAEEEGSAGDSSSDELQIVAEKGPLACRDFPHSRHSCSNFPFSTTSHEKYCNMCHCFVCDTPAPCNYWCNGTPVIDHCHATDKEGKWKTLRQAFKGKSLPASGPDKLQNVMCTTVTSLRQQTQAMQCQVAVPQSLLSSASNMDNPSRENQSALLNEMSQNQQRHHSVRLSLSVSGTVGTPRAGGLSNAHIALNNNSRAIFKRSGALSPGLKTARPSRFGSVAAPDNSLLHPTLAHVSRPTQVARRTNVFAGAAQNNPPQRSFSAPIAFQAQQGQPAAFRQVASNGINVIGPQLSRCTSLTTERTQCLQEPVIDVSTQSWEDILASVASDLGVPDYNTTMSQHLATDSGPVHSTVSQGTLQHGSVAATENLPYVHDLSNQTTGGNIQANDPLQTTENRHHLNGQSSLDPNRAHLNDFATAPADESLIEATDLNDFGSAPADESLIEAARELEISRLESANILFELDWV